MKLFLTFALACLPLFCFGAPSVSYTSYFNNVHVYTNITLGGVTRNTWPSSSGVSGTVINTGASTVGAVPRYTDTTGTNVAPTSVTIDGTTGAVRITNSTSASVSLGIDAFDGMTNTPFYVKRGGSNMVDIGQHPTLTGGLMALRLWHNGPYNATNFLYFMDIGDDSGASVKSHLPTGLVRRQHTGQFVNNLYYNQATKFWTVYDTNYPASNVEVGQEGVTLHVSAPGTANWGTDFHELFQARSIGVEGSGGPSSGYYNQAKSTLYLEQTAAADWRSLTQLPIWVRMENTDTTRLEMTRYEQAGANATGGIVYFRKARGDLATKGTVISNDFGGIVRWEGYDGANYQPIADISGRVDGAPSAGDMPGSIDFRTVPDGSATLTTQMKLRQSGALNLVTGPIGIGSATTPDVGFARTSAGVARISDGSSGRGTLDATAYQATGIQGISTTWTNIISGVITQRISTIGGIVVTNLTL